jgi:hypothetical protein
VGFGGGRVEEVVGGIGVTVGGMAVSIAGIGEPAAGIAMAESVVTGGWAGVGELLFAVSSIKARAVASSVKSRLQAGKYSANSTAAMKIEAVDGRVFISVQTPFLREFLVLNRLDLDKAPPVESDWSGYRPSWYFIIVVASRSWILQVADPLYYSSTEYHLYCLLISPEFHLHFPFE